MDPVGAIRDKAILIATTPRSGSWLLSDLLSSAAPVGAAREYFHVNYVAAHSRELGLPTTTISSAYLGALLGAAERDGVAFCTKLHWVQINQLVDALREIDPERAAAPAPELIAASLPNPKYLYLTRRDKARQAISLFRAFRTDSWWHVEGEPAPRTNPPADFLAVRWLEQDLLEQEAGWDRYFRTFGVVPHTVVYEELIDHPRDVLAGVFRWLGFGEPSGELSTRMRRQADAQTDLELAEYLSLRDSLPLMPRGWSWSHARRAFSSRAGIDAPANEGVRPQDLAPF